MRRLRFLAAALLAGAIAPVGVPADDEEPPPPRPVVAPHAAIDVGPSKPVAADLVRRVEALVQSLAGIKDDRFGVRTWAGGGVAFEPAEAGEAGQSPKDPAEAAFRALVTLGADAMPALLAHLDDATPTKFVVEHEGGFGGMWLGSEVQVNGALPDEVSAVARALSLPEKEVLDTYRLPDDHWVRDVSRHVVTVGDVCFAVLGEITNRGYEAVRYQPTMCLVVNSPTRDPRIARAVRAQWAGKDLRRALAKRLDQDVWTTGIDDRLPTGALVRLLTWFPDAAEGLVVALLDVVEVAGAERASEVSWPEGLDPVMLVERAAAAGSPAHVAAIRRLALRTQRARVLGAALRRLPGAKESDLQAVVLAAIEREPDADLLREVEARWPDRFAPILTRLFRTWDGVLVLVDLACGRTLPLPAGAWRRLLDVRNPARERPRLVENDPLERLRVCDVAAIQIARLRPDLPFDENAVPLERDAHIGEMRKTLDAEAKAAGGGK